MEPEWQTGLCCLPVQGAHHAGGQARPQRVTRTASEEGKILGLSKPLQLKIYHPLELPYCRMFAGVTEEHRDGWR